MSGDDLDDVTRNTVGCCHIGDGIPRHVTHIRNSLPVAELCCSLNGMILGNKRVLRYIFKGNGQWHSGIGGSGEFDPVTLKHLRGGYDGTQFDFIGERSARSHVDDFAELLLME